MHSACGSADKKEALLLPLLLLPLLLLVVLIVPRRDVPGW